MIFILGFFLDQINKNNYYNNPAQMSESLLVECLPVELKRYLFEMLTPKAATLLSRTCKSFYYVHREYVERYFESLPTADARFFTDPEKLYQNEMKRQSKLLLYNCIEVTNFNDLLKEFY